MTTFSPPLSGTVFAVLVDVLDLRRWDSSGVLRSRNSRHYLSGERVSPEAEAAVQGAIAEAVVASELVPSTLCLDDVLPRTPAEMPLVPATTVVKVALALYARKWDELAGALRRSTAPVAFPNQAAGACLRLVAIDLAVRITAILWFTGKHHESPVPLFWTMRKGMSIWLRSLVKEIGMTRDALAQALRVHPNTLDGWLDDDARPSFENLDDLARALASRGLGERIELLRQLRLAFAARDLFGRVEAIVGTQHAIDVCQRTAFYAIEMLSFPKVSKKPVEENNLKMRIALGVGTLGSESMGATWILSMLNHLWRHERDPVWRTSLRAVSGSWFEHLQHVTAKLGPVDRDKLAAVLGREPTDTDLEALTYVVQATRDELAAEPGGADVMVGQVARGGDMGAVELMSLAGEASLRGDRLGAIELLRGAIVEDPTNADFHFRLGCNLWQVGDLSQGLAELELAVQLDPSWDRPRVEIAIVLLNAGRDEEALARLQRARVELAKVSTWVLLNLAYAHERLWHVDEAIRVYEELLAIEGDQAEALDRVAHLYFITGNKRAGAARAKAAAHLGIPTVLGAWKDGYYAGEVSDERPAHVGLGDLIHFGELAGRVRARVSKS